MHDVQNGEEVHDWETLHIKRTSTTIHPQHVDNLLQLLLPVKKK